MASRYKRQVQKRIMRIELCRQALVLQAEKKPLTPAQEQHIADVQKHLNQAMKGLSIERIVPLQPCLYPHSKARLKPQALAHIMQMIRKWA